MGICIFFVPISTSFAFTVTLHFFKGIAGGVLNVFCNTVMMLIWAEKANTFMQLLHFSNGVGSTISPIILTVINSMMNGYVSGVFSDWAVTYTIVAIMTALAGVFCMFCPRMDVQEKQATSPNSIELTTPESPSANSPDDTSDTTKLIPKKPRREQALYFRILACSITSAALYFYVEAPYSGLIFTFIRLKRLSDDTGANMANSLFWLTLTIGRLLAIPLASMMKSRTMLIVDITGSFIAVLSMLMFRDSYTIVMIGKFCFRY
jgi:MFS family permease